MARIVQTRRLLADWPFILSPDKVIGALFGSEDRRTPTCDLNSGFCTKGNSRSTRTIIGVLVVSGSLSVVRGRTSDLGKQGLRRLCKELADAGF
jgi:hypothetical protein